MKQTHSHSWLIAPVFICALVLAALIIWHGGLFKGGLLMLAMIASFVLVFAVLVSKRPLIGESLSWSAFFSRPPTTGQGGDSDLDPIDPPPLLPAPCYEDFPIAVLRITTDNRVSDCNKAARRILGLSPGETPRFDALTTGLGRSVECWLSSYRNTGKASRPEILETRRDTFAEVLQVSLFDSGTGHDGVLWATLSDATQMQSLQAQIVQSQKMQAIGHLAGGVAHDFNNLLTAISGYCDLLLLRHEKNEQDYGDLVQISQNANRAAALVGQLLAFSRKQTLQPQVLDVNMVLSDLSHLLNRLLGEKTTLNNVYGKNLPEVFVDLRQLEQVIMNLVVNARDAMPDGGEIEIISALQSYETDTKVQKATIPAGRYVSIAVRDTGHGIDPVNLQKVFEPFFSTKKTGEGTGLGLSMAYGIIKQTGGFLFADSEKGKGTQFSIILPLYDGKKQPVEPVASPSKPKAAALTGLSVLLVEDEAPVRAFAARAMRMHGVNVTEAENADSALAFLENPDEPADVIISDVVMPGMDGPTWVHIARQNRPDVKVIFVSGYAEEVFSKGNAEISNAVFLPKPFSLKKLIETLRQLSA